MMYAYVHVSHCVCMGIGTALSVIPQLSTFTWIPEIQTVKELNLGFQTLWQVSLHAELKLKGIYIER